MTCRIFNFLYNLLPFTAWHALLIKLHFARCPRCSQEFEIDEDLKSITIKPEQVPPGPDLWAAVRQRLNLQSQRLSERFQRWLKLFDIILLIFVMVILILFIFLIFYFKTQP